MTTPEPADARPQPSDAPAYAMSATAAPSRSPGVSTNTPWIWLAILLPLIPTVGIVAVDWEAYLLASAIDPVAATFSPVLLTLTVLGWVTVALHIVFAFLDQRALTARGIDRPFSWFWSFTVLVVGPFVYPIGRAIVAKRRTGAGLAPLFVTIAGILVTVVVVSWVVVAAVIASIEIATSLTL